MFIINKELCQDLFYHFYTVVNKNKPINFSFFILYISVIYVLKVTINFYKCADEPTGLTKKN